MQAGPAGDSRGVLTVAEPVVVAEPALEPGGIRADPLGRVLGEDDPPRLFQQALAHLGIGRDALDVQRVGVLERALRPSRWRGERDADRLGPAVQADLVHRARLPRHRPGHQPAQRLLRSQVLGEFHAAFLAGLARRRHSAGLSRGDVSVVGRSREQPTVLGLRRPDGACPRKRRLDMGRAALSVLPGADRHLDRWRELAARALADRTARGGFAGRAGPAPLPARRAARGADRRHRPLGRGRGLRHHGAGKPARLDHHAVAPLRLRRRRDRRGDPLRHARPGLRRHPRARRSGGTPRRRRAGTDARPGDRTAAGPEMAGRACRRGLRRGPRRGAAHHRGHDADCLGELSNGRAARGGRTPLPPRADGGVGGPRDGGAPSAALAPRARSCRCDPARPRRAAGRSAPSLHRRRGGARHRGGAPGPGDLRSAARRAARSRRPRSPMSTRSSARRRVACPGAPR